MIKASYRAFTQVCTLCVELIRQFYDEPRQFRILGERGAMEFIQYSNAGIRPQEQGQAFGVELGTGCRYSISRSGHRRAALSPS